MKSIYKFTMLGVMATITTIAIANVGQTMTRKSETEDVLSISMRNTLKATSVNKMYEVSESEMSAELLRNIAESMNTDSAIDVYIFDWSTDGLLDVKMIESFKHINGVDGLATSRKTLILEDYPK